MPPATRGWMMHWLFLLMAVGALYVGFTVTSTPVMVVAIYKQQSTTSSSTTGLS